MMNARRMIEVVESNREADADESDRVATTEDANGFVSVNLTCGMDVKLSIGEEDVSMSKPLKGEIKKDGMDSLKEEDIWIGGRDCINYALMAARTAMGQDPEKMYTAAWRLENVIKGANVEEFISMMQSLADQTDLAAILNMLELSRGSILHIAAETGRDDILRLLIDHVPDYLVAVQNVWGYTALHVAIKAERFRAAEMLIHRARDLPNVLRMQNKRGNTALHEAVLNRDIKMVRLLLSEDMDLVYLKNAEQKSPLYLAIDTHNEQILEGLLSLPLESSRIQGLPPVHGAVLRHQVGLLAQILERNKKLFAMTDSKGGNVFHFAAYIKCTRVFEFLRSDTAYLARERDMNGDLPIHVASKMGNVHIIEKLHRVSEFPNRRGQTVLHVAAKYGQASAVKYMLKHPEMRKLINERDHAGNTPLHLAAMHSQPAALITLMLDERIKPLLLNHKCLAAWQIARDNFMRDYSRGDATVREVLATIPLHPTFGMTTDLLVLRPEARDKEFIMVHSRKDIPPVDMFKDVLNIRILVAALVTTVTFAAGFAVPGGFDSSDRASRDDRGMAVMLDKRMFQAFVICNSIAMFSSMLMVINLMFAQETDSLSLISAFRSSLMQLTIALPAMCAAFLTGVTLTVGKLPWLANIIFYLGLLFLLFITGSALLLYPLYYRADHRTIHRLQCWLALGFIYFRGIKTFIWEDSEEDETKSETSASRPLDDAGELKPDDTVTAKHGDSLHHPSH